MRIVIVGGVAGGASAAARARRLSEEAEIIVFERGPDVSFANCGMPYYISEEITPRDKLLVVKPEMLRNRYNIDVRTRCSVEAIDRQNKTVRVQDLATGQTLEQPYDKLVLSPGASPLRPPIPGLDLPGIYTLRNLEDMDRIKSAIDQSHDHVVIVGAGFIGLELAEGLVHRGIRTSIVELQDQVLPPLDKEMTTPLNKHLRAKGVNLVLGQSASAFEGDGDHLRVILQSSDSLVANVVVLGIGVKPENQLAVDAGLEVGPRGGIVVNAHMQTTDADIYAVGDAVQITDFVTGTPTQIPLAGPANRQGRIAADHIFGRDSRYRGTQGTAIVRVFDMTAAATGSSEKILKRVGKDFRKIYIHPINHAGYYPGAEGMSLKVLFDPTDGKILGAQGVGGAGVDKRIDVLAMAIQAGFTVFDLEETELAYSPQYGSAKDPVNMVGFVASGLLREDHPQMHFDELLALEAGGQSPYVVDVRTPQEYKAGHVPGAVNIPVDELRLRLDELPKDAPIAMYCKVGMRGYLATRIAKQNGFDALNLAGGYTTYRMFVPEEGAVRVGK
ncbi:MAG: FAD-dependent oxidoreductase [Gemmataceae bacterium]